MFLPVLRSALGRSIFVKAFQLTPNARLPLSSALTRSFLTTALNQYPTAAKSTKAKSSKPKSTKPKSTKPKSTKPKATKARPKAKVAKPAQKKFLLKDLKPPFKRPASAYIAFVGEYHKKHAKNGENLRPFLTEVAREWSKLSDAEKQTYAPSQESLDKYWEQRHEWINNLPPDQKSAYRKRTRRATRDGPTNAYIQFIKEEFAKLTDSSSPFSERILVVRDAYRALSDAEKEVYKQRAIESYDAKKAGIAASERI